MPQPPNARTSTLTPQYRYNAAAGRYIARDGTFVPNDRIRRAVERQIDRSGKVIANLSQQLQAGEIDLREWRLGMQRELKTLHVANAAAAKGGWAQMAPADYGRAGQRLKVQYEYLNRFASEVQYGKQPLDGRFSLRSQMYAQAGRNTYSETERADKGQRGYAWERRVLGAADHCPGCMEQAAMGWRPLGTLDPIGAEQCKTNCHCHFEYARDEEGQRAVDQRIARMEQSRPRGGLGDDWREAVEITWQNTARSPFPLPTSDEEIVRIGSLGDVGIEELSGSPIALKGSVRNDYRRKHQGQFDIERAEARMPDVVDNPEIIFEGSKKNTFVLASRLDEEFYVLVPVKILPNGERWVQTLYVDSQVRFQKRKRKVLFRK